MIEWLAGLNDTKAFNEFINLKKKKEVDWWDEISAEERAEIEEGLAQADRGEVVPHEKVIAKYKNGFRNRLDLASFARSFKSFEGDRVA